MKTLTIGQVARMAGVRVDTIRYYERRGFLPAPERRPTLHGPGYRRYDAGVVGGFGSSGRLSGWVSRFRTSLNC